PSSRERWVARSTALMNVVRIPPSSSAAMPAIEVPPGEQTMSLTAPGWSPVSRSSAAAPRTVWVARVIAVIRSSPIRTPPSARVLAQDRADLRGGDAGGDRDQELAARDRGRDLRQHGIHDLRLHRQDHDVGVADQLGVVRRDLDPVLAVELLEALEAHVGCVD